MDNAELRRGRPTVQKKWNSNVAILSGDAAAITAYKYIETVEDPYLRQVINYFNKMAMDICKGQQYDMEFETRDDVTEAEYIHMIFLKTAASGEPLTLLIPCFIMTAILICSAFTDCELGIIPNEFTYFGMVCGLLFAALVPSAWHLESRVTAFLLSLVSLAVSGGLMALCAIVGKRIFRREALGWGDVKFVAAAGALTGLPGALFMVLAGSLAGLACAPFLRLIPKYRKRRTLRFGPFLAFGILIWIFFGETLVRMYLQILN